MKEQIFRKTQILYNMGNKNSNLKGFLPPFLAIFGFYEKNASIIIPHIIID